MLTAQPGREGDRQRDRQTVISPGAHDVVYANAEEQTRFPVRFAPQSARIYETC